MKRIDAKKLNHYFNSSANSFEMKQFVQNSVNHYLEDEQVDPKIIAFLDDLNLLME